MLQKIRRNVRHPYIQGLLGIVILVFIFFFGWSMRSQQPTYVARVNGETIDYRAYQQAYSGLLRLYQEAYKEALTGDRIREMALGRRALDQLVDQALLLQEAARRGVRISEEDLRRAIESVAAFQGSAGFSKERYLQVLDANRITPLEYESSKRREILLATVEQEIRQEAEVTAAEIEQEYRDRNTKIALEFVRFDPAQLEPEVEVTDDRLGEFYATEQESFRVPEKRSARYLLVAPAAFLDAVEVTEEEARDEFNWRADEFAVQEAVRARHILIRIPPDGGEAADAEALEKVTKARADILGGADFATLAKKISEDPGSQSRGGDLGFFERGKMVPAFEQAAFALEAGAVSEPVRTPFGYHLVYVEERREAKRPEFEEIRATLTADLKQRRALERAYAAADNLLMDLEDGVTSWEALAQEREVLTTAVIQAGETIEDVEKADDFAELLFSLAPDKAGNLLETKAGTYVLAVAEVVPSTVPALETVREAATAKFRRAEAKQLAEGRANEFLAQVAAADWDEAVRAFGVTVENSGEFAKKGGSVPNLGWAPELKEAAFQLANAGDVVPTAHEVGGMTCVARLASRAEADLAGLDGERQQLLAELLPKKQDEHFQAVLAQLRADAELEITEELLL